jgi:hypothetical protein
MLMGATPVSPFQELSLAPLVRLLRKMTLINLFKKAAGSNREGWDWKKAVGPIFSGAKQEMWHDFEPPPESVTKRKQRVHIGAHRGLLPFSASRVRRMVKKPTLQSKRGRTSSRTSRNSV